MEIDKWKVAPSFDEVQACFLKIGQIKARIKVLKAQIDIATVPIKKAHPRKPWLILEATQQQHSELVQLEAELDVLEATRDFLQFHKEIYKAKGFQL
jgi:hypothetical protein